MADFKSYEWPFNGPGFDQRIDSLKKAMANVVIKNTTSGMRFEPDNSRNLIDLSGKPLTPETLMLGKRTIEGMPDFEELTVASRRMQREMRALPSRPGAAGGRPAPPEHGGGRTGGAGGIPGAHPTPVRRQQAPRLRELRPGGPEPGAIRLDAPESPGNDGRPGPPASPGPCRADRIRCPAEAPDRAGPNVDQGPKSQTGGQGARPQRGELTWKP